ncbi:MAG: CBS domain-containing protein, partial [Gammaproteobacteria bacterium]
MITVEDIMTRHPKTLRAKDTLADARRLMTEFEIRHIPVLSDAGALVGLVTLRDVLAASSSVLDES